MEIWFTSDIHFGHANIIKYSQRPFINVQGMDEKLIENWNTNVRDSDAIYHLGDFAFSGTERQVEILKQLRGIRIFFSGIMIKETTQRLLRN